MKKYLLGLIAAPLLAYPIVAGCLLLADEWRGERLLGHYLRYDQRLLWDTFWSDYPAATLVFYVGIGTVVGMFFLVRRLFPSRVSAGLIVPAFAAVGWTAGALLTGRVAGLAQLALCASGIVLAVPVALCTRGIIRSSTGDLA